MFRISKPKRLTALHIGFVSILLLVPGLVFGSEPAPDAAQDGATSFELILAQPIFAQPIFAQPIFANAFCQADCGGFADVSCSIVGSCEATSCSLGQPGFVQCGSTRVDCPSACSVCVSDGHCNGSCLSDPDCTPLDPCAEDGFCSLLCIAGGGTDPDCGPGGGGPGSGCLADGICNCNCILITGRPIGDPDCSPINNCVNCQSRPDCTDHAHCGPGYCTSTNPNVPGTCNCP